MISLSLTLSLQETAEALLDNDGLITRDAEADCVRSAEVRESSIECYTRVPQEANRKRDHYHESNARAHTRHL